MFNFSKFNPSVQPERPVADSKASHLKLPKGQHCYKQNKEKQKWHIKAKQSHFGQPTIGGLHM